MHLRDIYFNLIYDHFKNGNKENYVIMTNDFGAPSLDRIIKDFPQYYINVGICEQNLVTMAVGMAAEGFRPIVYSISSFLIYRAYEQIKLDVSVHNSKVILLGVGTGYSYDVDGPTHHITEDLSLMYNLKNLKIFSPFDKDTIIKTFKKTSLINSPIWIRMDRGSHELGKKFIDLKDFYLFKNLKKNNLIICTGTITTLLSKILDKSILDIDILSIFKLKPLNQKLLLELINGYKRILIIEEHNEMLGLFSIINTLVNGKIDKQTMMIPMGIKEKFIYNYDKRDKSFEKIGITLKNILKKFKI